MALFTVIVPGGFGSLVVLAYFLRTTASVQGKGRQTTLSPPRAYQATDGPGGTLLLIPMASTELPLSMVSS
jgi:hypothetical protein